MSFNAQEIHAIPLAPEMDGIALSKKNSSLNHTAGHVAHLIAR